MDGTAHAVALSLLLATTSLAGCIAPEEVPPVLQEVLEGTAGPAAASEPWLLDEPRPGTSPAPGQNMTIEVLDVGQGDAILLHLPDATVLVDTGTWYGGSSQAILDHLEADGLTRLTALLITHPDADHSGGCDVVLDKLPVQAIFHPGLPKESATWRDCQRAIQTEQTEEGAALLTDGVVDPGHHLNVSQHATVQALHVDRSDTDAPNEGGLVLRVSYGTVDMLLTGDISCPTEEEILARGLTVEAEILKVGHHGSKHSTCEPWLQAVDPEVGIISVGENSYGHPSEDVLGRLAGHGADVYRTDEVGTVTVTTDGTGWAPSSTPG